MDLFWVPFALTVKSRGGVVRPYGALHMVAEKYAKAKEEAKACVLEGYGSQPYC